MGKQVVCEGDDDDDDASSMSSGLEDSKDSCRNMSSLTAVVSFWSREALLLVAIAVMAILDDDDG